MRPEGNTATTQPPLANRAESIQRSLIREMFDLAQQYERADADLVHLEIGEPDFDTPSHIVDAAARAVSEGATHYTANAGLLSLRQAISDDLAGKNYDPESEIIVTAGAMEALALTFLSVVDPGEEVLIPSPAWPNYWTQTAMVGGEPIEVPLNPADGFALDADRIIERISDETSLVVLTTPSNPTGQVYEKESVGRVISAAADHDAYVVADEVYKDLTYDREMTSVVECTPHTDHVITLGSCSKTYAMTGWRVGWLAATPPVTEVATKLHESVTACAPAVSQYAAIAALTGSQEPVRSMHSAFSERREYVVDRIAELPAVSCPRPDGAFYLLVDVSSVGSDSVTIAKQLLDDYGVVAAPGSGFGSRVDDHLRISFANDMARLEEGFDRFEAFLEAEGQR
jgi:aspartate aminotransferase